MKPPQAAETSESPVKRGFRLAPDQMLPAVCPSCGAPGTQPEALHIEGSEETAVEPVEVDAHFCDICAADRASNRTRDLGLLATTVILVIATATATALALGTRDLLLQIVSTLGAATLLPEVLYRTAWKAERQAIELRQHEGRSLLLCRSNRFAREMVEHGFSEVIEPNLPRPAAWKTRRATIGLVSGGLAWLALVHSLGGAEVRVLVSGREKAVLLVDARHSGTIAPTNAEDPRAGGSLRILGGRRKLELVSHSGLRLGGATRTIWPGRTYIVGQLPPGECLFWERRKYGKDGSRSLLFPVGGEGPVWELGDQVDSWFLPLEARDAEKGKEGADWETSGGVRRAIRLLPCRGAL